jgi:hypothetical protein
MIELIAACLFAFQPLAVTGNEDGVWFVGDLDPAIVEFDSKKRNFEFAICKRVQPDSYLIQRFLVHRPVNLAVLNNSLWLVHNDYLSSGFSVYRASSPNTDPTDTRLSMFMTLALNGDVEATDLIVYNDKLLVVCGGECLSLFSCVGMEFQELLPLCEQPNAKVANVNGSLVAAVPNKMGVTLWHLTEDEWVEGDSVALQGTFEKILSKDGWILLVSRQDQQGHVLGIQHAAPIEIATFAIPKGRWSTVPSPEGLTVIGVERNGTLTALDLGWPSGATSGSVVMHRTGDSRPSIFMRYPFMLPALLFGAFLILRIRRAHSNKAKKEGS